MSYRGQTYQLPFDRGGLNHNRNIDLIPPEAMVHPSINLNLHQGGRGKRGGTAHVNSVAIVGTPRITGLRDYHLINGNQFQVIATGDGKIWKDTVTTLKTGLTINRFSHMEIMADEIYITNGADRPQIWDGVAGTTTDITSVPADWAGSNNPTQFVVHGRGASERMWAFRCPNNPNSIYASKSGDGKNFSDADVVKLSIDTGDGSGIVGGVEFGDRLICFGKRRSFIIDDTDVNPANWGYIGAQWYGGVAHHRLIVKTPNNIICMMDDGEIYSVTTAESYGDYNLASLTRPAFINEWIKDYIDLTKIDDFHAIYCPTLRAVKFFMIRKGQTFVDMALVYFIDRSAEEAWIPHGNFDFDSGYKASCSALVRVGGMYKIYTGGWEDGFVWELGKINKNDNNQGYVSLAKTARLPFENARVSKRYDSTWVITQQEGAFSLFIKVWIDGKILPLKEISLSVTGDIFGAAVFGTAVFGEDFLIDERLNVGDIGKRIQFEIFNNNANEDFFLSQLITDHKILGM